MSDRKPAEYLIVIIIANLLFVVIAIFFANYVFVEWQKIPMEYYGYDTLFKYKEAYGNVKAVEKAIYGSMGAGGILWIILNFILLIALFSKPKRELHGSARFANESEIRRTGFLPNPKEEKKLKKKFPSRPPVIIGKFKDRFLQFYGNEFVSIGAPTRSGKGVSIVIPNLLTYPDSIVVLDVKLENWNLTAGFRAKYQDVYLFSPRNEELNPETGKFENFSHCYNPLDYINRDEEKRMSDIQNIAQIFYPADDPKDSFWQNQAQRIFTGLVLYMMETPDRPCTMSELIKLTTPTAMPLHEWIPETIEKRKKENVLINAETQEMAVKPLTVECVEALMAYVNVDSDNTRSSILATLMSPLNIFTDPAVACATSRSDFRLDDVRKKKMTIYVGVQPNELSRFSKLLNVLFSQLIDLNSTLPEHNKSLKYQCLVLLDEFTSLGRVDIIQKSIAYIAGYNMRLMPIFQSRSQVEDEYGKNGANAIFSNISCKIEFTPTEQDQAELMSKILGTETVKGKSISQNRGKGGGGSISTSDQNRSLMLAQELMEMSDDEQIIFFRRTKPIKCEKAFYYSNPQVFASRMTRLSEPAEGLPIPKDKKPPKLDISAMLNVMRGYKPPNDLNDLPTAEEMAKDKRYENHFHQINQLFGWEDDFAELDKQLTNGV